jgi:hypothetical protein
MNGPVTKHNTKEYGGHGGKTQHSVGADVIDFLEPVWGLLARRESNFRTPIIQPMGVIFGPKMEE